MHSVSEEPPQLVQSHFSYHRPPKRGGQLFARLLFSGGVISHGCHENVYMCWLLDAVLKPAFSSSCIANICNLVIEGTRQVAF